MAGNSWDATIKLLSSLVALGVAPVKGAMGN